MKNSVTIIMYHYVRNLFYSRYPAIKGLEVNLFQEQIDYLKKHYSFVSMEMLIDAIDNDTPLPQRSVLLTFDDAYVDHFKYVFPILDEKKIKGAFYPPIKAITEHKVLDVNKIHHILASVADKSIITIEIKKELNLLRSHYRLKEFEYYYKKLAVPNRFDDADTIFIKRILQVELEEQVRKMITDKLFTKFVGIDEASFSRELYMNTDQIKCMHRNGMHIGSHGFDHYWLGSLTKDEQENEIQKSLAFLDSIGCDRNSWTMCYPYGNYNEATIEILKENKCKLALTTEVNIAFPNQNNRFTLPRLDTNDIPKHKDAKHNEWYFRT